MTPRSGGLFQLFHSDGDMGPIAVAGRDAPAFLTGEAPHWRPTGRPGLDGIVLAPSIDECRSGAAEAWAKAAAGDLATDGVVYAIAPISWRRRITRWLVDTGMFPDGSYMHTGYGGEGHALVPPEPEVVRYALATHPPRGTKGRVARLAWELPGIGPLAAGMMYPRGVAFRRTSERALMSWTSVGAGINRPARRALIRQREVGSEATAVVALFESAGTIPSGIFKVPLTEGARLKCSHEYETIRQLCAGVRSAGASIPEVAMVPRGPSQALRLEVLAGRSAATLLRKDPARLWPVVERVSGWISRWHALTRKPSSERGLERTVFGPARRIAGSLPNGQDYVNWLGNASLEQVWGDLPFVAGHNDLTSVNVMLDGEHVAVIDWESAAEEALPLTDYFYWAADAVAASRGYRGHEATLIEAFDTSTQSGTKIVETARKMGHLLGLSEMQIEMARHACVVHHAANEVGRGPGRPHPFLHVARWMAGRCEGARR